MNIAKRGKDDGELGDAYITYEEAYDGILQHYNNSACCFWCGIGLVFLGDSGPSQYSPDRPDPPQTYLDGWVASCLACNRLFNDLSENERTRFMGVLIEKYDPYRHEVETRKLSVSEMKTITGATYNAQVRRKKSRVWTKEECLNKSIQSGGVCAVTGIAGSFDINSGFLRLVFDRVYDDDPYDIETTQIIFARLNDMKESDKRFKKRENNPEGVSSIAAMREHVCRLCIHQLESKDRHLPETLLLLQKFSELTYMYSYICQKFLLGQTLFFLCAESNLVKEEKAVPAQMAAARKVAPKKASAHSDSDGDDYDDAVSLWRGIACNVIFTVPLKLCFFDNLVRFSTQSHQESRTQKKHRDNKSPCC